MFLKSTRNRTKMKEKTPLTLEEKHEILFDIMKDVDSFCRDNNIRYSISDGTMLGAIRHGGFIPWDDDIDICMLREDFDRFAETYKSDRYHLLYKTDNGTEFFNAGFMKVNDPTTYWEGPEKKLIYEHGVAIDIFPFDGVPEDEKERKDWMHLIRSVDNRLYHKHKKDLLSKFKSRGLSIDGWWNKLNQLVHDSRYDDSPLVGQTVCVKDDHVVMRKDMFDNIVDIPFNGYNFRGFGDYHGYLSFLFGPDYMTPKKWAHDFTIYRR